MGGGGRGKENMMRVRLPKKWLYILVCTLHVMSVLCMHTHTHKI